MFQYSTRRPPLLILLPVTDNCPGPSLNQRYGLKVGGDDSGNFLKMDFKSPYIAVEEEAGCLSLILFLL